MREMSDETSLLRDAIGEVLSRATAPMSSVEIYDDAAVRTLGITTYRVSRELKALYKRQKQVFPLKRIPHHTGKSKWAYFNPRVVKLAYTPAEPPREAPAQGPVNGVKPEFTFDPIDFAPPAVTAEIADQPEPAPEPRSTVKSITVSVSGISIKIDLDFHTIGE